jgi:uncharacterized protein YutE (UPF0331/DUF86 family)
VKKKADITLEIKSLIQQGEALPYDSDSGSFSFVTPSGHAEAQYWLSKTIAALESFLPTTSFHFTEAVSLAKGSRRQGGFIKQDIDALLGHLRFLRDAIERDLLRSFQNEVSSVEFADFLGHARQYLDEGKKVEASVIAAATFEDAVKRLAQAHDIEDLSKLDSIINALKAKGVVSSIDAKRMRYLAGIRNSALHASWDEFDLDVVRDLVEGVERLLSDLAHAPYNT